MNTKNNDYYSVEDFGLAVSLSTLFTLEKLDRSNGKRASFIFKKVPGIQRIADEYWKGTLKVPAVQFYQNLKTIKSRLINDLE